MNFHHQTNPSVLARCARERREALEKDSFFMSREAIKEFLPPQKYERRNKINVNHRFDCNDVVFGW
jgi:hypothetical protein